MYMKGPAQSVNSIATYVFPSQYSFWLFELLFFSYTKYIFDPVSQLFIFMEKLLIQRQAY